jgi:hypothetical protein
MEDIREKMAALILEAQAIEAAAVGPHVGLWPGVGDRLRACLRQHDHGGSDLEPGPECRVWVTEDLWIRHLQ